MLLDVREVSMESITERQQIADLASFVYGRIKTSEKVACFILKFVGDRYTLNKFSSEAISYLKVISLKAKNDLKI